MMKQIFCVRMYYKSKSFKIVQIRYKRKFNFCTCPNSNQSFKLIKKVEAYDSCEHCRETAITEMIQAITQKELCTQLSTTSHIVFNSAFKWKVVIWSMYFRASLDIFGSCLRLNGCRSKNFTFLPFNKCNFNYSIIWVHRFVTNSFVSKTLCIIYFNILSSHFSSKTKKKC